MISFVLHVYTKDPHKSPWAIHFDGGPIETFQSVKINCTIETFASGHTPCANWYLKGHAEQVYKDNDRCEIW